MTLKGALLITAALALLAGCGAGSTSTETKPTFTTPQVADPLPSAGPLDTIGGDGTYLVGVDIQPGTYHTTGSAMTARCYWERAADTSGTTASIIANELAFGPATVTIAETDGAFRTSMCAPWTKVS